MMLGMDGHNMGHESVIIEHQQDPIIEDPEIYSPDINAEQNIAQ